MEMKSVKINTSDEKFSSLLLRMLDEDMEVAILVTGDSMFPLWEHKRDTVILSNCDQANLRRGDIPLYRRVTGQYVMHRIIKVNSKSYNLCGDAQTQIEFNVPTESIIAVVKAFIRKGKRYNCSNLCVRLYNTIWMWLLPVRGTILVVYRKLRGFFK